MYDIDENVAAGSYVGYDRSETRPAPGLAAQFPRLPEISIRPVFASRSRARMGT